MIEPGLQTAPGVGQIVAVTLIAGLPELGRSDRRQIAALAPIARDSGTRSGRRTIWALSVREQDYRVPAMAA